MAATAARQVAVFWDFGKVIGYSLELTYGLISTVQRTVDRLSLCQVTDS